MREEDKEKGRKEKLSNEGRRGGKARRENVMLEGGRMDV